MATPLSPRSPTSLNRNAETPVLTNKKFRSFTDIFEADRENDTQTAVSSHPPSSPFQTEVEQNQSAPSPSASARSRTSAQTRSPTKTFTIHEDPQVVRNLTRSDAEFEAWKAGTSEQQARKHQPLTMGDNTLSDLRERIYLEQAAAKPVPNDDNTYTNQQVLFDDNDDARTTMSDDTCFSTFSAVPNADMTLFAKLGNVTPTMFRSPTRPVTSGREAQTPNTARIFSRTAGSRSPSPTPRGPQQTRRDADTTNLLLDFTGDLYPPRSTRPTPSRRGTGSPAKTTTEPTLLSYINSQRMPSPAKSVMATPNSRRNLINLLDFDLPPQPTPRSIPTITVRELESLKSQYLSEISSLKASLSGREAEVDSLKKAINDAERRVGEAQESLRDERSAREHADTEREAWAKKGQEVESVLRSVREEFASADKERDELLQKLEESNRMREDAELQLSQANAKASVAPAEASATHSAPGSTMSDSEVNRRVNEQLDEKMENLARELHAVYKKKHETKVATLKKTYEQRSEKKCSELQQRLDGMSKQVEELQSSKDLTFSGELPNTLTATQQTEQRRRLETQSAELEEYKARLAGLAEEMKTMQQSHASLLEDLERERVEKGDLVAAVDEMLCLQADAGSSDGAEDFRRSIGRPSSGGARGGIPAPKASGIPGMGKSRMMSNIERMGLPRGGC